MESRAPAELTYAAQMAIRASGHRTAANLIKKISEAPEEAKLLMDFKQQVQLQSCYTGEEALALYIDTKLTRHSYKILRKQSLRKGHSIYPSVYRLTKTKNCCFPAEGSIAVDELSVSINVHEIVSFTARRLLKAQESIIIKDIADGTTLTLVCKWGGDGSSAHSTFKQKFLYEKESSDEYLFLISFVPIQLRVTNNPQKIIWKNPHPSSTRFCRPIRFLFAKETEALTVHEFETIRDEIDNLLSR